MCAEASFECRWCQETLPVEQRRKHDTSCPKAVVSCGASSAGCRFSAPRADLTAHESSCPLLALKPCLDGLMTRVDAQEASIQALRHRNNSLEYGIEEMKTLLQSAPRLDDPAAVPVPDEQQEPPFDSATHHLLSLHESLREEMDRVSGSVTDLDGRISMMVINENLRLKEEMTHMNAVLSAMRMQLQWLMSARLQTQSRFAPGPSAVGSQSNAPSADGPSPVRRLSDSSTKL